MYGNAQVIDYGKITGGRVGGVRKSAERGEVTSGGVVYGPVNIKDDEVVSDPCYVTCADKGTAPCPSAEPDGVYNYFTCSLQEAISIP